jgi:hypothetical protein
MSFENGFSNGAAEARSHSLRNSPSLLITMNPLQPTSASDLVDSL